MKHTSFLDLALVLWIRRYVKKHAPRPIVSLTARLTPEESRKQLLYLSNRELFDKIYSECAWGQSNDGSPFFSGEGSHDPEIVGGYVRTLRKFLAGLSLPAKPVIVDLGCGDFNVGSQLFDLSDNYVACDLVERVIAWNRQKFRLSNVNFLVLDICNEPLPPGDVVCIRQVFQHLSNTDILKVLEKVREKYKHLIVTEHLPSSPIFKHNAEKLSGPDIRLDSNSGVVLTSKPFLLRVTKEERLFEIAVKSGGIIRTTAYTLR